MLDTWVRYESFAALVSQCQFKGPIDFTEDWKIQSAEWN